MVWRVKKTKNMLRPMSRLHHEAQFEEERWRGVEIRISKNRVRWVTVVRSKAKQRVGWHAVETKKRKNSLKQINRSSPARQEEENWHRYGKLKRGEEDSRGFYKGQLEELDPYRYQRAQEDRHGYHKAQQGEENRHRYQRARQGEEDQHGYYKLCREEQYQQSYHRAPRGRGKDSNGYYKAHQEEDDQYGYQRARRGEKDQCRYQRTQRKNLGQLMYKKAQRENKDFHSHQNAQRQEKDQHGLKEKKTRIISKPMNALHQKTQLQKEKFHVFKTKKSQNTPQLTNGAHHKVHHKKRSTFNRQKPQDDTFALMALLKACAKDKDLQQGSIVHTDIITRGLLKNNVFIGSALVNMYAKCGAIEKAQEVFDKLPVQNVVSWTTLIAGYAQHGHVKEALTHFELMLLKGFLPDAFTFACVLRACTSVEAFDKGKSIHSLIVRDYPLIEENVHVGTALVDMYSKCGALEKAQEAFDKLPVQDVVSWTALIAGYAKHQLGEEALINFEQMQHEGFFPDVVTFACVLKACGGIRAACKGQHIHAQIVRHGLLENMFISTALVDMYANCGMLAEAQDSFDNLKVRDVVSWSALIGGYAQHGHGDEAMKCFEQMQHDGFTPDVVTLSYVLKACGSIRDSKKGQEIYSYIVRERMMDIYIGTVLVDMYVKCGALEKAKEVFGKLEVRDVVLWTALIAGYTNHGHDEEALCIFEQMLCEGFFPDAVTFASILKACGNIGAADKGQKLHAEIARHGLLEDGKSIGTALVDMYANLGMLYEAQELFNKLAVQDLVSWSVLIAGYAQLGKDKVVFGLFDKMIREGKRPDPVTFIAVLNTCCHRGLVDKGQLYFELISKDFGMLPVLEHHTCIIDLFGRAGILDKAVAVIEDMSVSANLTLWHTFMGACKKWRNTTLGSWAFQHAVQLSQMNAAPYVSIRNIYLDAVSIDNEDKYADQKSKYART